MIVPTVPTSLERLDQLISRAAEELIARQIRLNTLREVRGLLVGLRPLPDANGDVPPPQPEPAPEPEPETTPEANGRTYGNGPGQPDPNRQTDWNHPWNIASRRAGEARNGNGTATKPPPQRPRVNSVRHHQERAALYLAEHGPTGTRQLRQACGIPEGSTTRTFARNPLFTIQGGVVDLTNDGRRELLPAGQQAPAAAPGLSLEPEVEPVAPPPPAITATRRTIARFLREKGSLTWNQLQQLVSVHVTMLSDALCCDYFRREGTSYQLTPAGNNALLED